MQLFSPSVGLPPRIYPPTGGIGHCFATCWECGVGWATRPADRWSAAVALAPGREGRISLGRWKGRSGSAKDRKPQAPREREVPSDPGPLLGRASANKLPVSPFPQHGTTSSLFWTAHKLGPEGGSFGPLAHWPRAWPSVKIPTRTAPPARRSARQEAFLFPSKPRAKQASLFLRPFSVSNIDRQIRE